MLRRIVKISNLIMWPRLLAALALTAVMLAAAPLPLRAQSASASAASSDSAKPNLKIKVPELPSIRMIAVPSYGVTPLTVGFFANGVDPDGKGFVSYLWTFGDGGVSMDPPMMFFHVYKKPGTYIATVTATTANGRTATDYVGITVRPRSH